MLILRKDDTFEAGGITFTVRPERYTDGQQALELAENICEETWPEGKIQSDQTLEKWRSENLSKKQEERDPVPPDHFRMKCIGIATDIMFALRITSWDGVFQTEDEPAPCTTEAKIAFMGQQRQIFVELQRQILDREASVSKNSGTSQGGSETTEQTCATDADGTADTANSPCPAKTEKTATRPHRDSTTASADSSGCSGNLEAA